VAGNDHIVVVEQHRIRKAKGVDAIGDLANLVFRVGSCVSRIVLQVVDRLVRDLQF
jgi:hypothetical protein